MTAAAGPLDVTVNGDPHRLDAGTTVADLLAALDVEPRGVAVAVDGEVVTRRAWGTRVLVEGEHVEVLSIARGG